MRNNSSLFNHIANTLLYPDAKNREGSGWIKGSIHGETGQSNWKNGHGFLNGSNSRVGDLQYWGSVEVHDSGAITFLLNYT